MKYEMVIYVVSDVLLNIFVVSTTFHFIACDFFTVGLVLVLLKTIHSYGIARNTCEKGYTCFVENVLISSFHRQHFILNALLLVVSKAYNLL